MTVELAQAVGAADAQVSVAAALSADRVDAILTANDATAVGAATAARKLPSARRPGFIGATAMASVSSTDALDALDARQIDAIVAPRLADLAAALVDAPWQWLRGRENTTVVTHELLAPGSPGVERVRGDLAT